MKFSKVHAVEVIKAGLSSGVIKLRGAINASTPETAKKDADIDAAYLLKLLESIADEPNPGLHQ